MKIDFKEALQIATDYFGDDWVISCLDKGIDGWAFGALSLAYLEREDTVRLVGGKSPIYITRDKKIIEISPHIGMEVFLAKRNA